VRGGGTRREVKESIVQKVLIWDKENTTTLTESYRHSACKKLSITASFFVVCKQTATHPPNLAHSYDDREFVVNNFSGGWTL
jgi:hypothetical protein